ncbi:MAG TPA: hypothetical protein VES67_03515 [Vicinamibacterales bacterium]|nr:hypothetical protein [Vicinamibacterales bacterium]
MAQKTPPRRRNDLSGRFSTGVKRPLKSFLVLTLTLVTAVLVWLVASSTRAREQAASGAFDGESWFVLKRGYPTGRTPPAGALERAIRGRDGRPIARTQLNLPGDRWVSIGPQSIFVQNSLPYAGRVTAVAPHPTEANVVYLGADSGGIWRTTNGGTTWTSLTDGIAVPAIASLAIDPRNPQLLYATTIHRTYPIRLLRSTDGGNSWNVSSISTDRGDLSPAACSVNVYKACIPPSSGRIFLDPTRSGSADTSTVYFAGSSHLFRSDDSGRTFRTVLSLPIDLDFAGAAAPTRNPETEFLRDAAVDPTRPDRLYAAVAQPRCLDADCTRAQSTIFMYRSADGGVQWTRQEVASLGPYSLGNTRYADPGAVYVPRVRLAIAPSDPDVVAMAFRDEQIVRPRVYRSTNAGAQWTEISPPITSLTWPLALVFSPTDPNTIYVGSSGVHRTTNGGQTWSVMGSTHVDQTVLAFSANGTLISGNDGGIFLNTAGTNFAAMHGSLSITEFYSVSSHPSNGLLLAGGTQDNGTLVFQGNLGWSLVTGGDGGDTVFDPSPQNRILYAEVEWFFTANGANVFQFFRCQPTGCLSRSTGINRTVDGPFIPRMGMDPSNPSTIWLTAEHLFRTDNRAENWTTASPSVGNDERCWLDPTDGRVCAAARYFTAVAVAPSSSQTVYAGTLNGDVRVTTNRGDSWRSIAGTEAGPLPVRAVNDIVVDPQNAQIAYVSYSGFDENGSGRGHVFRTTNGGQSWQDLSGNLPDVPVNSLLIDPDSIGIGPSRVLYAGTDIGVFRVTLDGTTNWQVFGTGLPPVVVNRLAYNATTRQLLAATYGRGIWAISGRFGR